MCKFTRVCHTMVPETSQTSLSFYNMFLYLLTNLLIDLTFFY